MSNQLASLSCGGGSGATTLLVDNFNTAAVGTVLSAETPATGPSPTSAPTGVELKIAAGSKAVPGTGATGNGNVYLLSQSDVTVQVAIVFDGTGDDAGII